MKPSALRSKNELKPWLKEGYCISPKANAAFVCNMEDVLEVYTQPDDPKRPQVCMDETSKQLLADVQVTDQRARKDWAIAMLEFTDEIYPQAEKIVIVMGNLNTHSPASFYETFESD